jgi:hypothetical protein
VHGYADADTESDGHAYAIALEGGESAQGNSQVSRNSGADILNRKTGEGRTFRDSSPDEVVTIGDF